MPITIEQIKELMAKATDGEWTCSVKGEVARVSTKLTPSCWMKIAESSVENAAFIAALPSIAQLCIEQAEEIERLKAHIFDCSCQFHGEDNNGNCAICHGDDDQCAYCKTHNE